MIKTSSPRSRAKSRRRVSEADPPTVGCWLFIVFEILCFLPAILTIVWALYYAGGLAWDGSHQQFNWHPVCMVLSMATFFSNGIAAFRIYPFHRRTRKVLHALVHLMTLGIAVLGLAAVFQNHQINSIPHLYSLHSWCGLVVMCMVLTQWTGGILSFVFPILSNLKRSHFKPWHVRLGLMIFFGAIATCLIGFNEKMSFLGNHHHKRDEDHLTKLHAVIHEPEYRYSDLPTQAVLCNVIGLLLMFLAGVVFTIASQPDYTSGDKMRGFQLVSS